MIRLKIFLEVAQVKNKFLSVLKWLFLIPFSIGIICFLATAIYAVSSARYSKFSAVCGSLSIIFGILFYSTRAYRKKSEWEDLHDRVLDVLSTIDVVNDSFPYYDIKPYVLSCLDEYSDCIRSEKQHQYELQNGRVYRASPTEPVLFAFVCIGLYAVDSDNEKLRSYCDANIESARRAEHRHLR
jgi:hypothetical protein